MTTRDYFFFSLLGLLLTTPAIAAQEDRAKWTAHFDLEAKPGNKRTLGEAGLFLPLWQNNRTLLFGDLRTRFDNNDSREGNFGLGIRHMLSSGWNLGFYGYRDRRRSNLGNDYDQATVGFEALGQEWDFRANTYRPIGNRINDNGTSSSASLSGTSIQVVTETSEEHALPGYDAEVGWRAPVFNNAATRQLRLYAGGYHFSDNDVTVKGPRLRAELAMDELPLFGQRASLYLGAEAQDDEARGRQNFVSLRLSIPLGGSRDRAPALSSQERRMMAPVVRDVDIVTQPVIASRQVETASTTTDGQPITVISSSSTSGADLPAAVAAACNNSTVILSGTFNTTSTITLQSGQTLMGTGTVTVKTPSGHTANFSGKGATIEATVSGAPGAVAMANNSTLTGMTVNNTHSSGFGVMAVSVSNSSISNFTVANNTLSATENGSNNANTLAITSITIPSTGNVYNNKLSAHSGGLYASALLLNASSSVQLSVSNNTFSGTGYYTNRTISLWVGTINTSASTGNTLLNGGCYGGGITGSIGFADGSTCP